MAQHLARWRHCTGVRSVGGGLVGRMGAGNEGEGKAGRDEGYDLEGQLTEDDRGRGDDCFFSATGVRDGDVLQGVRYEGKGVATTESLVMRSRSGTVRRVRATHNRDEHDVAGIPLVASKPLCLTVFGNGLPGERRLLVAPVRDGDAEAVLAPRRFHAEEAGLPCRKLDHARGRGRVLVGIGIVALRTEHHRVVRRRRQSREGTSHGQAASAARSRVVST